MRDVDAQGVAAGTGASEGLKDLFSYPIMQCFQDRRTRRVAQGVSITAGDLSHQSANKPSPLTPLEEAILIAATGVTGAVIHDGPLVKTNKTAELGTPFLNSVGRAASSADNAQATSMIMINDEGTWLIQRPRGQAGIELLKDIPHRWEDRSEADWVAFGKAVKRKIYDERIDGPREWPYYLGWNAQHSNAPGTTVFLPVVDNTRQYINALLILLSEPKGKAPLVFDDFSTFKPKSLTEWGVWAASLSGLAPKIPYQPIGGIKRVQEGHFSKDVPLPFGTLQTARTDHEAFMLLQNLLLMGEAMRLGGWVHSAMLPPHIMKRDPAKGIYGLGFREHGGKQPRFGRWAPVPASQPNYVGIDGVLEGACPPYMTMNQAVDAVLEEKYSGSQVYGDPKVFGRAYRDEDKAKSYLRQASRFPKEAIEYTKEVCNYVYDTYGRFPMNTDAFYLPGIWAQFSHLEIEYYDKYASPSFYKRQAEGKAIWHRN
ncbi:MAG: hypothetical protein INR70_22970 [Parafilimonas terrae]|nr:hypothetical protein [Parafilimonas terrae]